MRKNIGVSCMHALNNAQLTILTHSYTSYLYSLYTTGEYHDELQQFIKPREAKMFLSPTMGRRPIDFRYPCMPSYYHTIDRFFTIDRVFFGCNVTLGAHNHYKT
jgi:hypothetical protein